jgi:serine protease Do
MNRHTLAAIVTAFGLGASVAGASELLHRSADDPAPQQPEGDYDPTRSLSPLIKPLQSAVVNLHVEQTVKNQMMPMFDFFGPFMGGQGHGGQQMPEYRVRTGQGSGFVISPDGYLLTNNHVVAGADKVTVKFDDDTELAGRVVGTDSRIDVALVKVEADGPLPYVALGNSTSTNVGDWVVAIGNPFGLSHTVTAGIVSAKGRVIGAGPYDDFIQTDASINPGNSGGPLFNLSGEVIGINTAVSRAGQGIGFAVPIDMVSPFLDDLKNEGEIARGWLGVSLQPLDEELAKGLDAPDEGVLLSEVHEAQPGEVAGLRPGDVVTGIDGSSVDEPAALIRAVGRHRAGDVIQLHITRAGKPRQVQVTLGKRPTEKEIRTVSFGNTQPTPPKTERAGGMGITVQQHPTGGLVVSAVARGTAADQRLQAGDRIQEINGRQVRTESEMKGALAGVRNHAVFVIHREGRRMYVAVPLR